MVIEVTFDGEIIQLVISLEPAFASVPAHRLPRQPRRQNGFEGTNSSQSLLSERIVEFIQVEETEPRENTETEQTVGGFRKL